MNGVPGLSPSQLKRLQDSQAIHERGRALVVSKGGVGIWEQPPSAMSWLEEANFHMLREHQCSLVWVDACQHGKTFAKSWAFGCNSPRIQALAARCSHTCKRTSIAGVVENGVFLSTLTAEYPETLARQLAAVGRKGVPNRGREACAAASSAAQPRAVPTPCLRRCGHAFDCRLVLPEPRPLQAVAVPWLRWLPERSMVPRIIAHVSQAGAGPMRPSKSQCHPS